MAVSAGFKTFIIEQLEATTADIRARAMFGGVGLYAGEIFFALIDNDTLYFKVDDETRAAFTDRGMAPFRPDGDAGEVMQYYQVPADLLEDADALQPWIADAVAVARRAKRAPKRRKPSSRVTASGLRGRGER